jgi:hypothetical protein
MEKIHKEKGYSVAPSSEYDYVGMDLRDYYLKGVPLLYNDHSSEAIEFSRDVQSFIEKKRKKRNSLSKKKSLSKKRKSIKRRSNKRRSKRH